MGLTLGGPIRRSRARPARPAPRTPKQQRGNGDSERQLGFHKANAVSARPWRRGRSTLGQARRPLWCQTFAISGFTANAMGKPTVSLMAAKTLSLPSRLSCCGLPNAIHLIVKPVPHDNRVAVLRTQDPLVVTRASMICAGFRKGLQVQTPVKQPKLANRSKASSVAPVRCFTHLGRPALLGSAGRTTASVCPRHALGPGQACIVPHHAQLHLTSHD